jgi:hypothetical protein
LPAGAALGAVAGVWAAASAEAIAVIMVIISKRMSGS